MTGKEPAQSPDAQITQRRTHEATDRYTLDASPLQTNGTSPLRAFGLSSFLRERYERLYDKHHAELRRVARRRLRLSLAGSLGMSTVLAVTIAGLLALALNGRIGLAEAATAAGAALLLGDSS